MTPRDAHARALLATLETRFTQHPERHRAVAWTEVVARLESDASALRALAAMEASGGEPDVIGREDETGTIIFCDCSPESPSGRRSCCFDEAALASRKANKPDDSADAICARIGIRMLDETEYRHLQSLGAFDTKTSSWIATPARVRALGGALFGDRRYDTVFIYHNGAESYYAARGVRGTLRV
jgi:hypothetical protein